MLLQCHHSHHLINTDGIHTLFPISTYMFTVYLRFTIKILESTPLPNELAKSPGVFPLMGGVGVMAPAGSGVGFMVVMTIWSSTAPSIVTRGSRSAARSSTRKPLYTNPAVEEGIVLEERVALIDSHVTMITVTKISLCTRVRDEGMGTLSINRLID